MTTITDAQYETIRDKYRDAVLIALDEITARTAHSMGFDGAPLLLTAREVVALLAAVDTLCKACLPRMGVAAIGDELLWKDPR